MPPGLPDVTFVGRLQDLLAADVPGLDAAAKAQVLRRAAEALERKGQPVQCRIVPFVPGRRPAAEAAHPGLGSSEKVALILPDEEQDLAFLLYDLDGGRRTRSARASRSRAPTDRSPRSPSRAGRTARRRR